jgi:hypothetical protein
MNDRTPCAKTRQYCSADRDDLACTRRPLWEAVAKSAKAARARKVAKRRSRRTRSSDTCNISHQVSKRMPRQPKKERCRADFQQTSCNCIKLSTEVLFVEYSSQKCSENFGFGNRVFQKHKVLEQPGCRPVSEKDRARILQQAAGGP